MKRILITIYIILFIAFPIHTFAQVEATPTGTQKTTPESTTKNLSDQINDLKERIASRVAQLNLVEKRGIVATVSEVSGARITVSDIHGETRFIDVDEITKFSSPSAKSTFGISDLKPGSVISVLGNYNKQSRRILARFIGTFTIPTYLTGHVVTIDRDAFTFTIASEGKKSTIIDVENITKTSSYTDEDEITRSGFSKLTIGDRIAVMGFANRTEKNRLTANRILIFPEIPKNPNIDASIQPTPTPTGAVSPTRSTIRRSPTPES
jgi:hypothetical protein